MPVYIVLKSTPMTVNIKREASKITNLTLITGITFGEY